MTNAANTAQETIQKSIVRVRFPARNTTLAYYNDQFELNVGDLVFVEGKLEGLQGRVVEVSHSFKIKISDYKRVVGRADTAVRGEFLMAGSHFIALAPDALPYEQALSWYKAPRKPEDEYITENSGERFSLEKLNELPISQEVADRGCDYYRDSRVRYLCLQGERGRAIVEGTRPYEVEFTYADGQVGSPVCDCYCSGICKHSFAVMLQLRETLEAARKLEVRWEDAGYLAAVQKIAFFLYAVQGKSGGRLTMDG